MLILCNAHVYWALFVGCEVIRAKSFFLFLKLIESDFTKASETKLDCSYDRTLSKSQIELSLNMLVNYQNMRF